ncbi:MAG TPA: methyltransferase domain-containing protein [Candidatus Limnocylindria bacterium]|nr:methyltransferase domain-containing protein [Candidatus Limnocylindria bacterium]
MSTSADQFSRTARAYLASDVHARGKDLLALVELARAEGADLAVDVGANVGHTLRAVAPHVRRAVGTDVALAALGLGRGATSAPNAHFAAADAAALPLGDGAAGLVTCRLAAHHFRDRALALGEMARVLAPGGLLLLADNYAPDDRGADRFINALEAARDPTHERAETIDGWLALARGAGLEPRVAGTWTARLVTEEWLDRAQTPPAAAERVRRMLAEAPAPIRATFGIDERSFLVLKVLVAARKPA